MSDYDFVLRQGMIYDGCGRDPWTGDVAVTGDRIVETAAHVHGRGASELDVSGLVVAPGFINMMSWGVETLIEDGRSMSDVMQGVTLEVMGEGTSMGPLSEAMREQMLIGGIDGNTDGYRYPIPWSTLSGYLSWLTERGVAVNVASFVGAGTLRVHEAGHVDRPLTDIELGQMCRLLDDEMRGGALGVASALIYPPETAYRTTELVALAKVAAAHGGMYASHIRSEGFEVVDAVAEVIDISRKATVRAEVYHLKVAGRANWPTLPRVISMIDEARSEGLPVTADMYPYEFAGTSLSACIPPWAHDGGPSALRTRLGSRVERERIRADMARSNWENPFLDAGPSGIQVRGPLSDDMAEFRDATLAEIAARRSVSPETAVMDLVRETPHEVFALYFDMDPNGVRLVARQPWVSFCSDAESLSVETARRRGDIHPRAFGAFARVLGALVRDEQHLELADAIRRMTSLPADNLRLIDRGRLRVGCYADIVVFDSDAITDHATPEHVEQYATGMVHVMVNGTPVVLDGSHTGAVPGRFVRGPGATPASSAR